MRRALGLTVGLCSLAAGTLIIRPSPVIKWLAKRWSDVLFYADVGEALVALTIEHPSQVST